MQLLECIELLCTGFGSVKYVKSSDSQLLAQDNYNLHVLQLSRLVLWSKITTG